MGKPDNLLDAVLSLASQRGLLYLEKNNETPDQVFLRFKKALKKLNLEQPNYPVVIIAGTNGKGSVAHGLSACLTHMGQKVGLFTSPHLFYFNERIRYQEKPVLEKYLLAALAEVKPIVLEYELNFFQISLLLALKIYAETIFQPDIAILEVGLGGRFDPVNALEPVLSIITSISKDHMEILGHDLSQIAWQKLGIARPGVPLIYADNHPQEVIVNNTIASEIKLYGRDFNYPSDWAEPKMAKENAAAVAQALQCLIADGRARGSAPTRPLGELISQLSAPGRMVELVDQDLKILIDVAHNEDSCRRLLKVIQEKLEKLNQPIKLHAVFTAKPSKDIRAMIGIMSSVIQDWHCVKLDQEDQSDIWLEFGGLNLHHYASLDQAYEGAKITAKSGDWLVCFGSFIVAATVLQRFKKNIN